MDRTKEYRLLQQVRRRAGKQIWSYSYFVPSAKIPQRAIDGPPEDSRLIFAWQAYENNAGWLLWDIASWTAGRPGSPALRDPYADPLSWAAGRNRSNGEASLIYPGYAPQYGLTDRDAAPVTSLRMEEMRDGIEDVDLAVLYRRRYGQGAVRAVYSGVFGRVQPTSPGGFTWPAYSYDGLADRLEQARRAMIDRLERG